MEQKLCCVKENIDCEIISISGMNKCRLLELGFIRGASVKIIRKSISNGPLEIVIKNYRMALRIEEAENIIVKII